MSAAVCFHDRAGENGNPEIVAVPRSSIFSPKSHHRKRMFSRAFTQATRNASRVVRSGSVKSVVKRHSHDHAGTPPPPFVQRKLPSKSVGSAERKELTISCRSTPS